MDNQAPDTKETLKVKFKLNGLEFELEGGEKVVREEFENFKSFISNDLLSKIIPPLSVGLPQSEESNNDFIKSLPEAEIASEDLPILREVIKRDLPKTEKDWILIYAFYLTNSGENTFTTKAIIKQYRDTGRWTINRSKKISENITALLNLNFIKAHNDEEYMFKPAGLDFAKNILQGKATETKTNKSSSNPSKPTKSKASKAKSIPLEKFDLHKDKSNISLEDFLIEKNPGKAAVNVIVVIGYYITKIRGHQSFSEGNIDYAYRTLSISNRPTFLRQVIINAKNNNDFFESTEDGRWTITRTGEIFVEEKLLHKK